MIGDCMANGYSWIERVEFNPIDGSRCTFMVRRCATPTAFFAVYSGGRNETAANPYKLW